MKVNSDSFRWGRASLGSLSLLLLVLTGCDLRGGADVQPSPGPAVAESTPLVAGEHPEAGSSQHPLAPPPVDTENITMAEPPLPQGRISMPVADNAPGQSLVELSAILANRDLHRSYGEVVKSRTERDEPPEGARCFRKAGYNLGLTRICGERLPLVSFENHPDQLKEVLSVAYDLPFGLALPLTAEAESSLQILRERAPENLVHLFVTLQGASDEACRQLGEIPHVKSLDVGYGVSAKQLQLMLSADRFEAVFIRHLGEIDTQELGDILRPLKNLKRLQIRQQVGIQTASMTPVYLALIDMPQLEFLSLTTGQSSQADVAMFFQMGEHPRLQELEITSEPLSYALQDLDRFPRLEELSLCVYSLDVWAQRAVLALLPRDREPTLRKLKLMPMTHDGKEAESFSGLAALSLISALARHTSLEYPDVPLSVESVGSLEAFTRMPRLRLLPVKTLNLNRETLTLLCRMPHLEALEVRSLEFGAESAHLLPWLPILSLHITQPATLTDERARMLGQASRLKYVSWWDNCGMSKFTHDIPHIDFREYD